MVLQLIAAAAIVLVSAAYAAWRLMPARARLWLIEHAMPARFARPAAAAAAEAGCQSCPASQRERGPD
ncbi:MAG TPA: hypothetical protein VLW26_11775 [Steroidobacteraceae bacterium]|nr:hypothetical protein [Steroidobacteraceae bacterium]